MANKRAKPEEIVSKLRQVVNRGGLGNLNRPDKWIFCSQVA